MTAGASSQATNPEPRPPGPLLGVKLHTGPRSHTWTVMGSGPLSGPTLFPRSRGGERPPSTPLAPLPLPAASSAPLLLFPKSTPLIHDFPPQSGLLSTTLHQRPPPPDQRHSIRSWVGFQASLTSLVLPCNLSSPPTREASGLQTSVVTPAHPLPARAVTAALPGPPLTQPIFLSSLLSVRGQQT